MEHTLYLAPLVKKRFSSVQKIGLVLEEVSTSNGTWEILTLDNLVRVGTVVLPNEKWQILIFFVQLKRVRVIFYHLQILLN